jgi:hypothetical protein
MLLLITEHFNTVLCVRKVHGFFNILVTMLSLSIVSRQLMLTLPQPIQIQICYRDCISQYVGNIGMSCCDLVGGFEALSSLILYFY